MEQERNVGTNHKKNYERAFQRLIDGTDKFLVDKNRETTIRFLRDAEIGKTILKGQKKKIGEGRLIKMYGFLKKMDLEWFKKSFDEVTEEEMMNFILSLEKGLIKSNRDKPYTLETQSTLKRFIRKFYKYLLGDSVNYPKLIQFIDTSTRLPEIRAISKEENDKLISLSSKMIHKVALALFFDGGMRVRELYNIKISDISKESSIISPSIIVPL